MISTKSTTQFFFLSFSPVRALFSSPSIHTSYPPPASVFLPCAPDRPSKISCRWGGTTGAGWYPFPSASLPPAPWLPSRLHDTENVYDRFSASTCIPLARVSSFAAAIYLAENLLSSLDTTRVQWDDCEVARRSRLVWVRGYA